MAVLLPLFGIVLQIYGLVNGEHKVKSRAAAEELTAQLPTSDILHIQVGEFALQVVLVDEKATVQLAEEFSAKAHLFPIVGLASSVVAVEQEHGEDTPLEPSAAVPLGAVFRHIGNADEGRVASAVGKEVFQIADATARARQEPVLPREFVFLC